MAIALGQRPKQEFAKKMVVIVNIITGKERAELTITEDGDKKFSNGTKKMRVALADLPKVPRLKPDNKVGKEYRVRMSEDGTEVENITPVQGHFTAKLTDIGPRPEKDADPTPREKVWNEGKSNENRYLEFFAVYQITEGAFKGVQMPAFNMHYKFEEDPENEGYARFAGNFDNPKATRLFQLRDWGLTHGLWNEPIPWDDVTILPTLLDRALENEKEVDIIVKRGYISEVMALDEPDDDEDENPFGEEDVTQDDTRSAEVDAMLDASKSNGNKPAKVTKPKKSVAKAKVLVADDEDDL
jgi:hypothetical protein